MLGEPRRPDCNSMPGVHNCLVADSGDLDRIQAHPWRGGVPTDVEQAAARGGNREEHLKTEDLGITGMTCAACAIAVERSVKKLEGVVSAAVNPATEKLTVEYDETRVDDEALKLSIEKAGYGVAQPSAAKTVVIPVRGMTCAACSAAIERALRKLAGVTSASVNLTTEKATIVYDPALVRVSALKNAITAAGYTPLDVEVTAVNVDEDAKRKAQETRSLWQRFIVSALFAAPLLYPVSYTHLTLPTIYS